MVHFIGLEIRMVAAGDQEGMEMIGWWLLGTRRGWNSRTVVARDQEGMEMIGW